MRRAFSGPGLRAASAAYAPRGHASLGAEVSEVKILGEMLWSTNAPE